jgi:hypothetical protein
MKQTAVEYIEKAYSDASYNMMIHKIQIHKDFLPNLFEKAKEMEKQQQGYSEEDIKHAFFSGCYSERKIKPRIN